MEEDKPLMRLTLSIALITMGWVALATLPSPLWRVVPTLLFFLSSIASRPTMLGGQVKLNARKAAAGIAILLAVLVLGVMFDRLYGAAEMERVLRSIGFCATAWALSLGMIFLWRTLKHKGS